MSGSNGADGSRFMHLLQPIRDLSQNWNIDLAQELEEYLDELEHLSIAIDPSDEEAGASVGVATRAKKAQADGARVMNFAEAALLIQGTSVIYSRKVEYLYALVFQTLAHLTRPQDAAAARASASDEDGGGHAARADGTDGDDDDASDVFANPLPVVDELDEARNITLRVVGAESQRQRGGGSVAKSNTNIQAAISLMGSLIPDERDHGETFKLLSCTLHASGVLLLDETSKKYLGLAGAYDEDGDDYAVGGSQRAFATTRSDPVATLNFDSVADDFFMDGADNDGGDGDGDVDYGYADDQHDDNDGDNDDSRRDGVAPDDAEATSGATSGRQVSFGAQAATTPSTPSRAARHQERDPWAPLDPYDASGSTSRPFRKGRSYPKPKKPKPKKKSKTTTGADNDDDDAVSALDDPRFQKRFLFGTSRPQWASWVWTDTTDENALERKCKSKFCKAPLLVKSCDELWKLETKWKALLRRRAAKAAQSAEAMLLQEQAEEEEEQQMHALGLDMAGGVNALDMDLNAHDDDGDVDDDNGDDGVAYDGGDWDQGGPDDELALSSQYVGTLGRFKDDEADGGAYSSDPNAPLSYDDICRQHLQSFMHGADKYVRETNLSKQVNDWQSTLAPILKEQDERPPFDIHTYGREILGQLAHETKVKHEGGPSSQPKKRKAAVDGGGADADDGDEANIPFEDIVGGLSQYEVCRMFLASLQLANNGNVQLVHGRSATEQSRVPFRMKLLTTSNVYESLQSQEQEAAV
ncbi:hypothetical protein PybrP1_006482 [[Pythium] brassicae (nom. inval.)]|nr:hypothetical protein PybrP1_006482 [[Pythium] brassicae (nom. inval.)]